MLKSQAYMDGNFIIEDNLLFKGLLASVSAVSLFWIDVLEQYQQGPLP